ncbi:MAG: tetratricopeptide repeat protein [Deltaproteobacteria bacterium]|nr:tetratricopeptide repeat protein [Deltaproteobacteria bacterium]
MISKSIVHLLAAFALLAGPGCNRIDLAGSGARPPADAQSVVLVTIDTLRADHVGAYGAETVATPTLDAIAAEGVRFETAITATPLTLPSHSTILTGIDPPDHGVRNNGTFRLGEEATTLAERFQTAGWATGAFVGSVVLKSRYGLDQGFDVYGEDVQGEKAAAGGFLERRASEVVDEARAWLAETEGPFFLWLHLYDPHMDYKAPPEFAARFPDRPYDAEIAYTDAEVGRLLAGLGTEGRLERTLVVVTSDHGESLGEHGETTHSTALYDAVLKVPLVMKGPGLPAGRVVPGVVRVKDIAPTVLAQVGLAALPEASGQDLTPRFTAETLAGETVAYSETLATLYDNGWAPLHSVRTDEWFYVRSPRAELYDVVRDPLQLDNLIETDPDRARPHHARLDGLVDAALSEEKNGTSLEVDDATRAQLNALGYAITAEPVAATGIDPKDGRQYLPILHSAIGAYEVGDVERAERLFLEVAEKLPGSGRSHSRLASIYYQEGRHRRALVHIELALSFDPRSALNHSIRGEVLLAMGQREEAAESYRRAIAADPKAPWSRVGKMWQALEAGDVAAAARHAAGAMADEPGNTGVFLRIAALWSEYGEYGRAVPVLEEAVSISPTSAFAHIRLAIEYARTGKPERALQEREKAGALATNGKLGTALGRAFAAAGEFERAEWQLGRVLAEHPNHTGARESLDRVHVWQAKRADAGQG